MGVAILNVDHSAAADVSSHLTDLGLSDPLPDAMFIARLGKHAGPESRALHELIVNALVQAPAAT